MQKSYLRIFIGPLTLAVTNMLKTACKFSFISIRFSLKTTIIEKMRNNETDKLVACKPTIIPTEIYSPNSCAL